MFEAHGWATLRECAGDADDDAELQRIARRVTAELARFELTHREAGLRWLNGSPTVWLAVNHNHACDDPVRLFQSLADTAPGAYGLLHVWDDEGDQPNAFQVHVLRRGRLELRLDPWLSPCAPVIEDP
ncbi:MAG: Imm7 family immunity protein [Planctomycetota bacterium]